MGERLRVSPLVGIQLGGLPIHIVEKPGSGKQVSKFFCCAIRKGWHGRRLSAGERFFPRFH